MPRDGEEALPSKRWNFVTGDNYRANEEAILTKIDYERLAGRKMIVEIEDTCAECGNVRRLFEREGKLVCAVCQSKRWRMPEPAAPVVAVELVAVKKDRKRGGPYYLQTPTMTEPVLLAGRSKQEAREVWCRRHERKRVPKGTKVWTA